MSAVAAMYGVETWIPAERNGAGENLRAADPVVAPAPEPPSRPGGGQVFGVSRPLNGDDDGPHAPTSEPMWRESNYLTFYDPRQELYGQCWMGFRPNLDRGEVQMYVYHAGRVLWKYVNWGGLKVSANERREELGPVRFSAVEPLTTWRLQVRDGNNHMDLTWRAAHAPYDYDWEPLTNSRRYQHGGTVEGSLHLNGEEWQLQEAYGERDRAWGTRDHSMFDQWSWFVAHSREHYAHGTILTVDGEDLLFGYLARRGGRMSPLVQLGMDTDYPYDLGPPQRGRYLAVAESGETVRLTAAAQHTRPSAFGDSGAFGVLYFCPARFEFDTGERGVGQLDYMWCRQDAYRRLLEATRLNRG